MPLSIGTKPGSYKILAPLGRGGMGEVYRARDTRLDREVAIKVLPEQLAEDPDALKRFEREAKAVAALSHSNILEIHDFGTDHGICYAVTELLQGETLRAVIGKRALSWRKAAEIGTAVAEGLAAAHSKGVIHRDLKPENVFITSDDRVKILDFGLARYNPQLSQQELTEAPTESKFTESGIVMGTVPYMSPEQVRGEHVDARTDIFSFGCVLHEMITGKGAFHRDTSAETISAILRDEPPELSDNIPAELSHVIARCLEKNPDKRFQTARDLVFALREVGHAVRPPTTRKSPRFVAVASSVVIALIAMAVLIVTLRKQTPFVQETAAPKIESLAVLPLKNLSGDPKQEYFSDGMTEELITKLGKIESLRVISRTSVMEYKGGHKKIPQIAKELNVDGVVEGSVLQAGDRVRITAQLIHAASDRQMWSESYERDMRDILGLQDEVARTIAEEIQIELSPQEKAKLSEAPKVHPEAYNAYLRRMELWNWGLAKSNELRLAAEMFERAVELDPSFALAYTQLSMVHSVLYADYMDRTLLEGETLRSTLAGGSFSWRKAVEIGTAVAEGLVVAHSKGVIHRDLKPENIFITSDDRVKILDFGLARYKPQLSQQEVTEAPTESKLTESGIVMGTVPYMSPEQVRGESVDARSDIFAFGCVVYEMATGKRAFHRNTSAETISAILRDEPPQLTENVPAELSHIITHCLEKNPEKRFQTARELVFALREVGAHGVRPMRKRPRFATVSWPASTNGARLVPLSWL